MTSSLMASISLMSRPTTRRAISRWSTMAEMSASYGAIWPQPVLPSLAVMRTSASDSRWKVSIDFTVSPRGTIAQSR